MDVEFANDDLSRLETDPRFTGGWPQAVVRGYRKAMQAIRAAVYEADLYALRGLRFHKLKGDRSHQHAMSINKQWRLIVEIEEQQKERKIKVIGIEDYH